MPEPSEAEVLTWLRDFMAARLAPVELDGMVGRIDQRIVDLVPQLADPELRRDLDLSTRAQVQGLVAALVNDERQVRLPVEARALARTLARRGFELRVLLHTYRAGQQAAIDFFGNVMDDYRLDPDFERAALLKAFEISTQWLGASIEHLTDVYMQERESGLRSAITRRAEAVREVLAGADVDPDQVSQRIGYRMYRRHLGYVLWSDSGDLDEDGAAGVLDTFAVKLAAELGAPTSLTVPSGARGMWGWLTLEAPADLAKLRDRRPFGLAAPVRVAFGAPGSGIDGFRRTHTEALAAQRVTVDAVNPSWLTDYREVELVSLVSADADAMRALVSRELTGLGPAEVKLRETLREYLACNRSPEATARSLGVHKNTVRYRIQRIEELLGHDIDSRRLPLEIALACVDAFGAH